MRSARSLPPMIAHDIARVDAERQRLFIERISSPSIPDDPKYPYRLITLLAVFGHNLDDDVRHR